METTNNDEFPSQGFLNFKDQLAKMMNNNDWGLSEEFNLDSESEEENIENNYSSTNKKPISIEACRLFEDDELSSKFHLNLNEVKSENEVEKSQNDEKNFDYAASENRNYRPKLNYRDLSSNISQLSDFGKIQISEDEINSQLMEMENIKKQKERTKEQQQNELKNKIEKKKYDIFLLNKYVHEQKDKIRQQNLTIKQLTNKINQQKITLFPENYCFEEDAKKTSTERELLLKTKNDELKSMLIESKKVLEELKQRNHTEETKVLYESISYLLKNHIS